MRWVIGQRVGNTDTREETMLTADERDAQPKPRKRHAGRGISVRFWSGASVVTDPAKYFGGEPEVEEQLQFFDWLLERERERRERNTGRATAAQGR